MSYEFLFDTVYLVVTYPSTIPICYLIQSIFFFNLKCDRNSNDKFSRTTYTWQKLYAVINWNLATVSSEGFFCLSALFNITANILRTGQSFNLTVSDTCNYDYTVNFGDSSPEQSLDNPQKIISHTYNRSGSYDVEVKSKSSSSSSSLCGNATKSIVVKDAIQNMVSYGAGGLLHRMAYTGWLHTKVVLFQAGLSKGRDFTSSSIMFIVRKSDIFPLGM